MWILALETATPAASVALLRDGEVVVEHNERSRRRHAESLVPVIDILLREQNLKPAELGAVACGIGPGSFTGLRIGLSTAKGLAQSLDLPLVTVSTLDILAAGVPCPDYLMVPLLDAKQGHIYAAFYRGDSPPPVPLTGYLALKPDELAEKVKSLAGDGPVVVFGDGARLCRSAFFAQEVLLRELPVGFGFPRAGVLGRLAHLRLAQGEAGDPALAEPLYVRRAAAEIAREARERASC